MRPSLVASVNYIAQNPGALLEYLKENDLPMFHKSNVFFRDFQYGLWRFLDLDQSKVSYQEVEQATRAVTDALASKGLLKKIDRQSFEVNDPKFAMAPPPSAAPPAAAKAAAPKAAAAKPAAEGVTSAPAEASSVQTASAPSAGPLSDADKAARIEELKKKMAEARQRTLAGG